MKLVALMSFFDEHPDRLLACMNHVADLGATDVVMVDGAYKLYPDGWPSSGWFPLYAVHEAMVRKMGCLFHAPQRVWEGNEIEKRQAMFDIAMSITGPDDYFLVWDSDWGLESEPLDLKQLLSGLPRYADVEISDAPAPMDAGWWHIRTILRAVRGMHYKTNHYTIHYPDGDSIVLAPRAADLERGVQAPVKIRHLRHDRPPGRFEKQVAYYERRHAEGIET